MDGAQRPAHPPSGTPQPPKGDLSRGVPREGWGAPPRGGAKLPELQILVEVAITQAPPLGPEVE